MEKRRDSKGRVLHCGEYQRPDGKYEFKYIDRDGKRRSVYSWKLTSTDRLPPGKRECKALRDMENEIRRKLDGGFAVSDTRTLNDCFDDYVEMRTDWKSSTRTLNVGSYDRHVRNGLGLKKVTEINHVDVLSLYSSLIDERNMLPQSIVVLNNTISPIFDLLVRSKVVSVNPTLGVMKEIRRRSRNKYQDQEKRKTLTEAEQKRFFEFVSNAPYDKYADIFTLMMGTGMRIGEVAGLRWQDCDFDDDVIHVRANVIYYRENGKMVYALDKPKTRRSTREIPMFPEVKETLTRIKDSCERKHGEVLADDTVFKNAYGGFLCSPTVNQALKKIVESANREAEAIWQNEGTKVTMLPHITCHMFRHTFCSRLCEQNVNLKVIQQLMGHSSYKMTMDIYTEISSEKSKELLGNADVFMGDF